MDNKELAEVMFPEIEQDISYYLELYRERDLPENAVVTRYAPSPTGFIHIGALYASFVERTFAKQTGGVFYLRIEDTDTKRTIDNGIATIIGDLKKFGVEFDEGPVSETDEKGNYGPYIQTKRKDIYIAFVKHLVSRGMAYPCFCSAEELAETRVHQKSDKEEIGYWGKWAKCRQFSSDEAGIRIKNGDKYIVRLRSEGDPAKKFTFNDLIKGKLSITENNLDIAIQKGDGYPTYHFAHLVDDTLMRTTHVIRADEWVASLPIHLQLFKMFDLKAPLYAHLSPILKNDNGSIRKLSKRKDPELAISYYFEIGMPTESILLYLATIVNSNFEIWYSQNKDARLEDFEFSFQKMSGSGAMFDLSKLNNISKDFISRLTATELFDKSLAYLKEYDPKFFDLFVQDRDYSIAALNIDREKPKPRKDMAVYSDIKPLIWYLYDELFVAPWDNIELINVDIVELYIHEYHNENDNIEDWMGRIKALAPEFGYASDVKVYKNDPEQYKGHIGNICEMLRYLVTSQTKSPDLYCIMHLLGKERIKKRLQAYKKWRTGKVL